jgi:hypothetical protein
MAMKLTKASLLILAVWAMGLARRSAVAAEGEAGRVLTVHLVQANNDSPYAFVRAKFRPGEVASAWAVRFVDEPGADIPFFVWDSVTWRETREGRSDWGHRYALSQHAAGDAPEVRAARARELVATEKTLPALGSRLRAEDEAAARAGESVCAALYLLRYRVAPGAKARVTLRLDPERPGEPVRRQWKGPQVDQRVAAGQGDLVFRDLPDRLAIAWKGEELLRSAGFQAGDHEAAVSHADPARPFAVETVEGIITRIAVRAQTEGRQGGAMDWQCTYWLFPEGSFVALEGFSLGSASGYLGGPQRLSLWQAEDAIRMRHGPLWETPWWLHQIGPRGFVATHMFFATPLAVGYGNNPFTVNAEGPDREPRVESTANRLALYWSHRLDDPAIVRLMVPQPPRRPGVAAPPPQPQPAAWQANVDWLYRQYIAGVGEQAESAESALRAVLGAAAGWIDRPVSEEETATLLVAMMPRIATGRQSAEINLLPVVPAVLRDDPAAIAAALARARDPAARTDEFIQMIRGHVARGGKPSEGRKKDDPDGTRREGWTGNACYHAALMPCYVRVLEHFDLPFRRQEAHEAIVRFADFSLELLGGKPLDLDALDATCRSEWPSRVVPLIPLLLHAETLRHDANYTRGVQRLFGDLAELVERNPHGYWPAWTFRPRADKFDTVYNPVGYERGIAALWSEEKLDLVGRDAAARFVAAQARWLVFSGQWLDTFEMDSVTAIRGSTHGAHTNLRNQIGIYLYDDFAFYGGLFADLIAWSAATCQVPDPGDDSGTGAYRSLELSNAGSSMLRWALGIRPGSKWLESQVERLGGDGFRLKAWNRRPRATPSVSVGGRELGLPVDSEVLRAQLSGPSYREPTVVAVTRADDALTVSVNRPVTVRLWYRAIRPDWPADMRPVLQRRGAAEEAVGDAVWQDGSVEWHAAPGDYRLRRVAR